MATTNTMKIDSPSLPSRPINLVDPSGHASGDVWAYRSDRSSISNSITNYSKYVDGGLTGPYSHASLELNYQNHYTANRTGSHIFEKASDILNNRDGNSPRIIDVYRHKNYSKFDSDLATYSTAKDSIEKNGTYGINGWCSERVQEGLSAGGLDYDDHGISTPNDFGRDSNFEIIGRYNTVEGRSEEIR